MFARRRPLLRTAAVAGGAMYVGRKTAQRDARLDALESQVQDQQIQTPPMQAAPMPPPAPAPPPPAAGGAPATAPQDRMAALQQLGELRASGVLTEEEFAFEKRRILAS